MIVGSVSPGCRAISRSVKSRCCPNVDSCSGFSAVDHVHDQPAVRPVHRDAHHLRCLEVLRRLEPGDREARAQPELAPGHAVRVARVAPRARTRTPSPGISTVAEDVRLSTDQGVDGGWDLVVALVDVRRRHPERGVRDRGGPGHPRRERRDQGHGDHRHADRRQDRTDEDHREHEQGERPEHAEDRERHADGVDPAAGRAHREPEPGSGHGGDAQPGDPIPAPRARGKGAHRPRSLPAQRPSECVRTVTSRRLTPAPCGRLAPHDRRTRLPTRAQRAARRGRVRRVRHRGPAVLLGLARLVREAPVGDRRRGAPRGERRRRDRGRAVRRGRVVAAGRAVRPARDPDGADRVGHRHARGRSSCETEPYANLTVVDAGDAPIVPDPVRSARCA